jgi:hypothetical protein
LGTSVVLSSLANLWRTTGWAVCAKPELRSTKNFSSGLFAAILSAIPQACSSVSKATVLGFWLVGFQMM